MQFDGNANAHSHVYRLTETAQDTLASTPQGTATPSSHCGGEHRLSDCTAELAYILQARHARVEVLCDRMIRSLSPAEQNFKDISARQNVQDLLSNTAARPIVLLVAEWHARSSLKHAK